ncbi:MAG: GDP-mannose 4,6-dehydratase [Kiritimatiellia bacterium]|jgi:GDP-4-dehydro-6-deoxy-D-mannose reductase|nr:GDP-mannose 4,6-dehydratase [Kiritimatiellia bacterium]
MRYLVTGGGGFVGRHLVAELQHHGHEVTVFDRAEVEPVESAETIVGDIRNKEDLLAAVTKSKPEACVHLGAIAYVPTGGTDPDLVLSVNIRGTLNTLSALRCEAPNARVLVVSTVHVYDANDDSTPLTEDSPLAPVSMYAISKAAADLATLACAAKHGLHTMTVRPTNHTGPGQSPCFAVPSFASQIKAIAEKKATLPLAVGNLESERVIMDVRDVVRAYRLLIEHGRAGQAYNLSSGEQIKIGDILRQLCDMAGVEPEFVVDDDKFRPTDRSPILNTSKLRRDTGWEPEIPLGKTLSDVLGEA